MVKTHLMLVRENLGGLSIAMTYEGLGGGDDVNKRLSNRRLERSESYHETHEFPLDISALLGTYSAIGKQNNLFYSQGRRFANLCKESYASDDDVSRCYR